MALDMNFFEEMERPILNEKAPEVDTSGAFFMVA